MAHKKIIDSVKKQGQVTIKDLDEFLRFVIYEYDMRTFDANYISILIPMQFDIDKVFGLNVCKRSDDDYRYCTIDTIYQGAIQRSYNSQSASIQADSSSGEPAFFVCERQKGALQ